MVEYANHYFNVYISDKDTEEQLLTENLVLSNLDEVKPLDDFVRLLLPPQTVMTSDHQIEKVQGKILEVMGLLSRLWKGLENIHKAPSHQAVEIRGDKFVTLVEHVTLLLGQASLSV